MLGIAADDPRPLTVTGGLPYFGGPGNNYVTHSIASMVETLRADPGSLGLVTANGWYVTKHSIGIYSTDPPRSEWRAHEPEGRPGRHRRRAAPAARGGARRRAPSSRPTPCCSTARARPNAASSSDGWPDGERFIANTPPDARTLESMTKHEMIGTKGRVSSGGDGINLFVPS